MIRENLYWAFEDGHRVQTPGGTGSTERHRLANIVLISGMLSIGYPDSDIVSVPGEIWHHPGTYPVFVTLARHKGGCNTMAFISVCYTNGKAVSWEKIGSFFTDSGDGVLFDTTAADLLKQKRREMSLQQWQQLKGQTLEGGDGNLILDDETGVNAVVFRTCDWSYDCFIGRDSANQVICLVVDGRVHSPRKRGTIARFWEMIRR